MMLDILFGVILGVVQGVTEFLPISSSGHLIIVRDALGITLANDLLFDVLLHFATAMAIIVYFWKDIRSMILEPRTHQMLWLAILLGTIPAVVFGLFFDTSIRNSSVVAVALVAGSILFLVAEKYATQTKGLTLQKGIAIGFFQALALIPGISRSGATISGGLLFGMKRDEAARFSFFLGLPVIIGAGFLESIRSFSAIVGGGIDVALFVGVFTAFVTGLVSIHFLLRFLKTHSLKIFAWYRIVLAVVILLFL